MAQQWSKVAIRTDQGEIVEAIAPVIISASRATDIPAFHALWFMKQLEQGYVLWKNPFNAAASQYVSFEKARLIVFWTKNPKPLMPYLPLFDAKGLHYYFQYTLNDYESEGFEPNVPELESRIETFKKLSDQIGKERVIWRFDPLLLSAKISVADLLEKIRCIGDELVSYTNKLVFSFADVLRYASVQRNLLKRSDHFTRENIALSEFAVQQKIEMAQGLQAMLYEWRKVNPKFKLATCAEDISLESYEIDHNKCIDDELIIRLFPEDAPLMNFLGYQPGMFGTADIRTEAEKKKLKDRNQRQFCGCIRSKDIGRYNTCPHLCIYCYANSG